MNSPTPSKLTTSNPANMLPRMTPIDFALGVPTPELELESSSLEPIGMTVPSTLKASQNPN